MSDGQGGFESIDDAVAEARSWTGQGTFQLLMSMDVLDDAGANGRVLSDRLRELGYRYVGVESRRGARLYKYESGTTETTREVASMELTLEDCLALAGSKSPFGYVLTAGIGVGAALSFAQWSDGGPPWYAWALLLSFSWALWADLRPDPDPREYFDRRTAHQHHRYAFDANTITVRYEGGREHFPWSKVEGWTVDDDFLWLSGVSLRSPLHLRAFSDEQRERVLSYLPREGEGLAPADFFFEWDLYSFQTEIDLT